MRQKTDYDVIIVGGAMTGVTLALALSSQTAGRIKIAVLEKQQTQHHQQHGFDARCIALSDGSCRRFDQIRLPNRQTLWQCLHPIITPIKTIHVSDKGHSGLTQFKAEEFNLTQLGAVIELHLVGQILLDSLKHYPNVDYYAPVDITQITRHETQVKVTLKHDRTFTAQLLVGADGSQSLVANAAKISQYLLRDYQQTAIITNVLPQQPHQYRAFERFTDEGPLALLPMQHNLMSLVWCVHNPESLMQCSQQHFLTQLQDRFGWRLGKLQQCGHRASYPLHLYQAEQHIQHRIALIGNAAQTLHPIAGQGFNLGICDVMQLAKVVAKHYLQQDDIGHYQNLQQYERERQQDQQRMINLTDSLLSIFANNLLPFQLGRTLGLLALSQSSLLRQHFAKPTLGWK
ncbi:2-octaprenyl-6-methoxyphenyl hydroxylase [Pasteurella sp. P03HT]